MMDRWTLKQNNKGASLIAVLVTIAVVGVMGIIISQITVTNIQMKEVERQGKTNFYDAEQVMDDLASGLNGVAAMAMETAYTDMLGRYREVTSGGDNLKNIFSRMYLNEMIETFNSDEASFSEPLRRKVTGTETDAYVRGYYDLETLRQALKTDSETGLAYTTEQQNEFVTTPVSGSKSVEYYHADYENKVFILENVQVSVKDDKGNLVTIRTNMVFHTPDINLDGSNLVKEFMRYSLIADEQISIGASGVVANGNVYAGSGGIYAGQNDEASFIGRKIITRGDVVASSKGTLNMGSSSDLTRSQIWAKNAKTERVRALEASADNHANLTLNGYSYISDDLEINGAYDEVAINGEYYGYNFQENYADSVSPNNAEFSSAIIINGKESNLNLTGVKRLMVAGRTFISKKAGFNEAGNTNDMDIRMGEAMAVRTNQIAYYVPISCVDTATNKIDEAAYYTYSGVPNVKSYLNTTNNVTPFKYKYMSAAPETIYYLNFASDQAANDFYSVYYSVRGSAVNYNAENYLQANALKLSSDVALTLRGDLLYRNAVSGNLSEYHTSIDATYWGEDKIYYNFSKNHAITYKSLQTNLEERNTSITADDVRFHETADNTMFKTLINVTEFNRILAACEDNRYIRDWTDSRADDNPDRIPGTKLIAIVQGDYDVTGYSGGLVVASGNVRVSGNFAGTIISGGVISFSNGASVNSDEVLISQMINDDIMLRTPAFATIFAGYADIAESEMGTTSINKYLSYENWTKTIE